MNNELHQRNRLSGPATRRDPLVSAALCERLQEASQWTRNRDVGVNFDRVCMGIGALGIGMFVRQLIESGELIAKLSGPIIRFDDAAKMGDFECYPLQVGFDKYVNLERPGCFFNHSCEPNSGLRGTSLFALRTIESGAEIRYDYSTSMDEDHFEMKCECGAPTCRGVVRDFKHLPQHVKLRYLELGVVQPFIAEQIHTTGSGPKTQVDDTRLRNDARV